MNSASHSFTDFGEILYRRSPYSANEYLWDSWESMKWQLHFNYRNKLYFASIFYMLCPIPIKSGRADAHSCWLCFMNIDAVKKFLSAIITFIFWFGWNALQLICILCFLNNRWTENCTFVIAVCTSVSK